MSIRTVATKAGGTVRVAARGGAIVWLPATGLSPESEDIRASIEEIRRELRKPISFSWRETLRNELANVVQNCSIAGWDGYDSEPVSAESEIAALQLIEVLPEYISLPDVTPLPSGEIAFEWRIGQDRYFTIRVSGTSLVYAGVFGGSCKKYGQEQFFNALPPAIQAILTQYFPSA